MGAVSRAVTENPTSQELDDGWSLGEEESLPLALRSIPETSSDTPMFAEEDLAGGWFLANEAEAEVPAVRTTSTLLNPLTEEELEFFSRAELAMGTEVDFPVPDEAWFDDLRCIVPRKRPASVADIGQDMPAPKLPVAEMQVAAAPVVEETDASVLLAPIPKKASWWKRLRRSKS